MAFFEFKNVRIAGIAAAVPERIISSLSGTEELSNKYSPEDLAKVTGVFERHVSDTLCASDLCFYAAEKLLNDLSWDRSEIEALVFVSQNADYILPCTACILQDRLHLSKECYAYDCTLGCSGWVYGLSQVMSLVSSGTIRKALLLCGEGKKRAVNSRSPLFGDAGTATSLEYCECTKSVKFHFGTDGSGYDAIIIPDGGSRNQFTENSFELEDVDGKMCHRLQSRMKGMNVFSFGINTASKSAKKLEDRFGFDYQEADYLVLHQANMKMNNIIARKLAFAPEKVPSCMYHFGNTSSASIPLTIVTQLGGGEIEGEDQVPVLWIWGRT